MTADRAGHQTIALPAIGAGNLRYPPNIVADTMFAAAEEFAKSGPKSATKIKFVIYQGDARSRQVR